VIFGSFEQPLFFSCSPFFSSLFKPLAGFEKRIATKICPVIVVEPGVLKLRMKKVNKFLILISFITMQVKTIA
jgi:hypothetical protein